MVCITNCAIGAAQIGGTIATAIVTENDPVFKDYRSKLEPSQIDALDRIAQNRLALYIQGTIVGIVLFALLAIFGGSQMSPTMGGCSFVAIVLLSQYFYYILMPKQDWMIKHLKTQKQNQAWLNVYRHMSYRWHMGLLIGLVGFFILGRGVVA